MKILMRASFKSRLRRKPASIIMHRPSDARDPLLLCRRMHTDLTLQGCNWPQPTTAINQSSVEENLPSVAAPSFLSLRDKLTTFIIKNPPEQKKGSKDKKAMRRAEKERLKEGEAADEELKKLKKVTKKGAAATSKPTTTKKKSGSDEDHLSPTASQVDDNGDHAEEDDDDDDDDDVQWQTDTSAEAARKRIQEQLSAATAEMVMLNTVQEPSQDEMKQPKKEKTSPSNGNNKAPEKPTFESILIEIKGYLNRNAPAKEVALFMESSSVPPKEAMSSLVEALFDGVGKGFAKEVEKKKKYLTAVVKDEASQILFLRALETFSEKSGKDVVNQVPLAVKFLYDGDVLEEENIVKWYGDGLSGNNKSSQLWKNMKPLIEWLQSAETDSEEE